MRGREQVGTGRSVRRVTRELRRLEALAARVGYAPHHFQRLFKRATGVTPAAYARALRASRAAPAWALRHD